MSWHFKPWSWELSPKSCSLLKGFTVLFLCYLYSKTLPCVPGCQTFPVAAVSSVLLPFASSLRSVHSITTKDSHCSKETDLPPWAPIKIYYSFPIVLAVIGALALCLVEFVGFSSPFHYYWNFAKDGKSENSKAHMYMPWGQQQHFNETCNLISHLSGVEEKSKWKNRYVSYDDIDYFLPLFVLFLQLMYPNYFTGKVFQQL